MDLSEEQFQTLVSIIQELCCGGKIIPRSVIFNSFEEKTKSGIERYKFEKELSQYINEGLIMDYKIKAGCKGGIYRNNKAIEVITITCSFGNFVGAIPFRKLSRLINGFKRLEEERQN
jgi:hypothetical protein